MKESRFQKQLINEIENTYPGCMILKNDEQYIQGIPDLLILYNNRWAALETKRSSNASKRPNQEYYINKLNNMSYASFVDPDNKQEVLDGLQDTFKPSR